MHNSSTTTFGSIARPLGPLALIVLGLALPASAQTATSSGSSPARAAASDATAVRLVWKRENIEFGEWPDELDREVVDVLNAWLPFARANGYRMDLNETGRVLMLSSAERNRSTRTWEGRINEALELTDELIPWVPPSATPNGVDPRQRLEDRQSVENLQVLVRLENEADRDALVDDLLRRAPGLQAWANDARNQSALLLRKPACAAWIESGKASVLSSEGECANRLTHLLLNERFGELPAFLEEGLAWYVEQELTGKLSSAPYLAESPRSLPRRGFEHDLRALFRGREDTPISVEDLLGMQHASWDAELAALAWGTSQHICALRPEAVSFLCADLSLGRQSLNWVEPGNGSWEGSGEKQWDAAELEKAIARHAGPTARSEWSAYFATGRISPRAR
ncbi:MAG: hypothetical protein ACI8QC_002151 [Planctomycetota bacterium]|jgi:hypothetical protein